MSRSWLGYLLNPQGPLFIREYFPGMILETQEILGGRSVYLVNNKTQNVLYFDVETGLLSRIGLSWEFQDYREVDGVKFPFRVATSRKGGESYFAFDEIEHNVPVDDRQFAIPDAGDVFADAFAGVKDSKVLPMLMMKDLSYEHGEMNVPCKDGRFLYDLIIRNGYTRGLEIGTFNGYSTLWLGLGFQKTEGRVITIEYDRVSGEEARKNFKKAGLEGVIDSRINDAFEEIPKIEGNFDFIFIDAWKPDYVKFLSLLKDRILPGGALVAHNVTNHARDMKDFLEAIQNDSTLETTFHEISAEGFSLSIKRK
jgi:predicted O-methyltransferase YrrM